MDNEEDKKRQDAETQAYLARIKRTVAESNALLSQVELRMAETDRMLASQGLTREQVQSMRFTPEQLKAVNEELRRRGLQPMELEDSAVPDEQDSAPITGKADIAPFDDADSSENLENRRRKFNVMMNRIKL